MLIEAAGVTVGAWLGDVVVRVARGEMVPLPVNWCEVLAELVEDRAQIQRVGVLLNQPAAVPHRAGQLPDDLAAAGERLGLVVRRLDGISGGNDATGLLRYLYGMTDKTTRATRPTARRAGMALGLRRRC